MSLEIDKSPFIVSTSKLVHEGSTEETECLEMLTNRKGAKWLNVFKGNEGPDVTRDSRQGFEDKTFETLGIDEIISCFKVVLKIDSSCLCY